MSRIKEAMLPLALTGAIAAGAPAANGAEKTVQQQHVEYCVDLYSGAVDNMHNGTDVQGADGKPDGMPGSVGYDFNIKGSRISRVNLDVDPQNLKEDFANCNDVDIERTATATVLDKRGKTIRTIARKVFSLDAAGTEREASVKPRRQLSKTGSNFMKVVVSASAEGYSSRSTVRTPSVKNYK